MFYQDTPTPVRFLSIIRSHPVNPFNILPSARLARRQSLRLPSCASPRLRGARWLPDVPVQIRDNELQGLDKIVFRVGMVSTMQAVSDAFRVDRGDISDGRGALKMIASIT